MTEPRYVRDASGNIVLRTYEISYRPQYVLAFAQAGEEPIPTGPWPDDMPGYRFHLSDEALGLVAAQGADPKRGFQRIEVVWDAMVSGPVMLRATQGVTEDQKQGGTALQERAVAEPSTSRASEAQSGGKRARNR